MDNKQNYSIPIIIDDVKKYQNFRMTRCTYFSIETDSPSPGWVLGLQRTSVPFFLLGLAGIIIKPVGDNQIFNSPKIINELFDMIENTRSLYVDVNNIWLPNDLIRHQKRGCVYRIDSKLFTEAMLFYENKINEKDFLHMCEELRTHVEFSELETEAFREWEKEQINKAVEIYPKNEEFVLKWPKKGEPSDSNE